MLPKVDFLFMLYVCNGSAGDSAVLHAFFSQGVKLKALPSGTLLGAVWGTKSKPDTGPYRLLAKAGGGGGPCHFHSHFIDNVSLMITPNFKGPNRMQPYHVHSKRNTGNIWWMVPMKTTENLKLICSKTSKHLLQSMYKMIGQAGFYLFIFVQFHILVLSQFK